MMNAECGMYELMEEDRERMFECTEMFSHECRQRKEEEGERWV
jgi:hypothetical protein